MNPGPGMLTASRLTRQMSLPMAELLHVLSIVTTRKFMMAAQVAVVGVWRPRPAPCFSTLSPSLADLRPLLSRLQSRGSIQLPDREFADPRVGLDCVTAIGVLETDLKSSSGAVILATGWACSSPQLICCGADGGVWQTTDTRPPGAVLEVVKRDRGSRSWCAMLPCG